MGRIKASDLIKEYSDNWDGRLTDPGDFAEYASCYIRDGCICDAITEYAHDCVVILMADAEGEVYRKLNEAMQCAAVSRIADEDGYIDREAWDEACNCMDDADNDDMCGDYIDRLADLYNSQMDDEAA